ncbi:hypothetical protein MMC20_005574 [Loxospora ochrophaea]|nr:hypothetical protein [Loxospora ochrophaea]
MWDIVHSAEAFIDPDSQYRKAAHFNVTHRRRQNFYALPTSHWQLLAAPPFNLLSYFDQVDDAIDANAEIAHRILNTGLRAFGLELEPTVSALDWRNAATHSDMDKARSTIRQLYRDWSAEGMVERECAYEPVLCDLVQAFSKASDRGAIKVLVPGAGLGRLVFEVCKMGFNVEGNEISYHQLITSNWILNHTRRDEQLDLYPFALTFSNHVKREHQLRAVKVPDIHPETELEISSAGKSSHAFERMSMTAGDFVVLYSAEEYRDAFDAVLTVYFVDTAPNFIRYIEAIHNCLKQDGLWINLGPLLWHFEESGPATSEEKKGQVYKGIENTRAGIGEPGSVELTEEELIQLIEKMGFRVEQHEIKSEGGGYIQDPQSMMRNGYSVSHWVARKMA